MRVLLAAASLFPAYGGPAYSVSRLAYALAGVGLEVGLWAPDQSAATTPLLPAASGVKRLVGNAAEALASFGDVAVVHDNGLWLPHNHALARTAAQLDIPRVVSTRGMLEPWAIHHKRWKKAMAWRAYQRRDLAHAQLHHATAEAEEDNVRRLGLGVPVCTIPNGVDLPAEVPRTAVGKVRTALFLGRIYPVKGLPMLVEAWRRVRPAGWSLQIAGPDEAGHRAHVERAVAEAALGSVVSFLGPLDGAAKEAALLNANLLVLPSLSESFAMVVGEALAYGVPVLTTTAVPWPGLAEHGCGWRVPPSVAGLSEGLRSVADCDAADLRAMGTRGREMVATDFRWERIAQRFVAAYQQLQGAAAE